MSPGAVATLLLGLAVIVVLARVLGALATRYGQPAVIGEIFGGILLGPTFLDGAVTNALFPRDVRPVLAALADVGVVVFMFLVGLELDRDLLRGQGRIAAGVSLSGFVLPFASGALLALHLLDNHPTGKPVAFVLCLGTAMSVSAFPVLARILTDKRLINTPIGGLALACAAVDDVLVWSMLAVVVTLADVGGDPWRVLLVLPYAAFMLRVLRPWLARLAAGGAGAGRRGGASVLAAVSAGLVLSAAATSWMGLHAIFGAFLFGTVMPRERASAFADQVLPWVRRACARVLLPVFFMVAGFAVDLSEVDGTAAGELALILLVAVGGKFAGGFAGARLNGIRPRHAAVLGILINTRGLTELIVVSIAMELGLLDARLGSLMIVMAVVTTAMTGVLLRLVYPEERVRQDALAREDSPVFTALDRAPAVPLRRKEPA